MNAKLMWRVPMLAGWVVLAEALGVPTAGSIITVARIKPK